MTDDASKAEDTVFGLRYQINQLIRIGAHDLDKIMKLVDIEVAARINTAEKAYSHLHRYDAGMDYCMICKLSPEQLIENTEILLGKPPKEGTEL